MGTVTYPNAEVVAAITTGFVPYQVNMLERHPDFREACNGGRVMWGPTFVVLDGRGTEVRRWVGWLPPASFVAELAFCQALAAYNRGDFADAFSAFGKIVEHHENAPIHAEALYWKGIAGFLAGPKDWGPLNAAWRRLATDHPNTRFGLHGSVIEDAPAPE